MQITNKVSIKYSTRSYYVMFAVNDAKNFIKISDRIFTEGK